MHNAHYLEELVKLQKQGIPRGICSICSANPFVIEATLEQGLEDETFVLIEATSNQVNQFGGYTGMNPQDFVDFVCSIAKIKQFPLNKLILGGDHLGPNPWKNEPAERAMEKAAELVREYIVAGFTKIHLDPSMHLADDPGKRGEPLDSTIVAERTGFLCSIAEEMFQEKQETLTPPVYVIGTEVPVPGGFQDASEGLHVTQVADFQETVQVSQEAFRQRGLSDAWQRVIAVVVQPGVEFGDHTIYEYQREKTQDLCRALRKFPNLVFEGHSTDYQRVSHLREMVEDGIAILKVGPALTFFMREALFSLCYIEDELLQNKHAVLQRSNLINVLDQAMLKHPAYWEKYYHGSDQERLFARKYSLSDRLRYYWAEPAVQHALQQLLANLESLEIPLSLVSQFLPQQYWKIREGTLDNNPKALVKDKIREILKMYAYATSAD